MVIHLFLFYFLKSGKLKQQLLYASIGKADGSLTVFASAFNLNHFSPTDACMNYPLASRYPPYVCRCGSSSRRRR